MSWRKGKQGKQHYYQTGYCKYCQNIAGQRAFVSSGENSSGMMDGGPNMSVCRLQPREFCSWWWVTVVLAILKKRTLFLTGGLDAKLHIDLNS